MKKVPKGQKCDGYLPVVYPPKGSPHIPRCNAPATVVAPKFSLGWDAYFCEKCAKAYLDKKGALGV